jgi:hypothetical protein
MSTQQNIPIVQGVAVTPSGGYQQSSGYVQASDDVYQPGDSGFNGVKGEPQPKQFQDVFWAVLFIAHLVVMLIIMIIMSPSVEESGYNYLGVVSCVSTCALVGVGISTLALGFMMQFATELVKVALFFSIGCSLALCIFAAMAGQIWMAVLGFVYFALGCCYAYFVWSRIPFAAANLRVALTAVRENLGLVVVSYVFLAIAFGWSMWWSVTVGSTISSVGSGVLFFFLLSYYWVHQVLQNTMHVTTAGVVGTWW